MIYGIEERDDLSENLDSLSNSLILGTLQDLEIQIYSAKPNLDAFEISHHTLKNYNLLINNMIPCIIDANLHLLAVSSKSNPISQSTTTSHHSLVKTHQVDLYRAEDRLVITRAYRNVIYRILENNGYVRVKNSLISFENEKFKTSFKLKPFFTQTFQLGIRISADTLFDNFLTDSIEPLDQVLRKNPVYLAPSGVIGTLTGNSITSEDTDQMNELINYWSAHYFFPSFLQNDPKSKASFVEVVINDDGNTYQCPFWYPSCFVFNLKSLKHINSNKLFSKTSPEAFNTNWMPSAIMNRMFSAQLKTQTDGPLLENHKSKLTPPVFKISGKLLSTSEYISFSKRKRTKSPSHLNLNLVDSKFRRNREYNSKDADCHEQNYLNNANDSKTLTKINASRSRQMLTENLQMEYNERDFEELWDEGYDGNFTFNSIKGLQSSSMSALFPIYYHKREVLFNSETLLDSKNNNSNKLNLNIAKNENSIPDAYLPLNLKYPQLLNSCPKYSKKLNDEADETDDADEIKSTEPFVDETYQPMHLEPLLFAYNILYPCKNTSKSIKLSVNYLNSLFSMFQNSSVCFFSDRAHNFEKLCLVFKNIKYLLLSASPSPSPSPSLKNELKSQRMNQSVQLESTKESSLIHHSISLPTIIFRREFYSYEINLNQYKFNDNSSLQPYGNKNNANIISLFPSFDHNLIDVLIKQTIVYYTDYHLGSLNNISGIPIEVSPNSDTFEDEYFTEIKHHLQIQMNLFKLDHYRRICEQILHQTTIFLIFYSGNSFLFCDEKKWIKKNAKYKAVLDSLLDSYNSFDYNNFKILLIPYKLSTHDVPYLSINTLKFSKWISFSCYESIAPMEIETDNMIPKLVIKAYNSLPFVSTVSSIDFKTSMSFVRNPIYLIRKSATKYMTPSLNWNSFVKHVTVEFMFCSFGYVVIDKSIWIWSIASDPHGKLQKYQSFVLSSFTENEEISTIVTDLILSHCNSISKCLTISSCHLILFPCNKDFFPTIIDDVGLTVECSPVMSSYTNGCSYNKKNFSYINTSSIGTFISVSIWNITDTFFNNGDQVVPSSLERFPGLLPYKNGQTVDSTSTLVKNSYNGETTVPPHSSGLNPAPPSYSNDRDLKSSCVPTKNYYNGDSSVTSPPNKISGILTFPKEQSLKSPYAFLTFVNLKKTDIFANKSYLFQMNHKAESSKTRGDFLNSINFFTNVMNTLSNMVWLNGSLILSDISLICLPPFLQHFINMRKILKSFYFKDKNV